MHDHSHQLSLGELTTEDKHNYNIELFVHNIPEPPCAILRWRFLVQAQFYTHHGYQLHINRKLEDADSWSDTDIEMSTREIGTGTETEAEAEAEAR